MWRQMRRVDGRGKSARGAAAGLPHAVAVAQNLCCSMKFTAAGGKEAGKAPN